MRDHIIIAYLAFKKSPLAAFFISATWLQAFIETSMPLLQWLLALAGIVFTIYQIRIKRKELQVLQNQISVHRDNNVGVTSGYTSLPS